MYIHVHVHAAPVPGGLADKIMVRRPTLALIVWASIVVFAEECEASPHHHDIGQPQAHGAQLLAHSASWRITRTPVSNGAIATVITDFLPPSMAHHWHSVLNSSWTRAAPCRESELGCKAGDQSGEEAGSVCSWLYTTNSRGGNQKIRSVWTREKRKREVQEMYARGGFSYSKWELTAGHELYRAMGELMEDPDVRTAIAKAHWPADADKPDVAASHLGNISDYFVTAYGDGDFLSTHSDGASGSLAWVLHLAKDGDWEGSSGGELRFNPGTNVNAARDFAPAFNRLLLFLTRPNHTPHQVLPVRRPPHAEPRFGATGWFMTRGDHFSAAVKQENDKMRAAALKGNNADTCL
jgi:hypothetical protein